MEKKYTNDALWRCLKAYPKERLFKRFMAQRDIMGFTTARYLEDILTNHFKTFSPSQLEYLDKKYDEILLDKTINNWHEIKTNVPDRTIRFLYEQIKYKKILNLNIPFNEADYNWTIMFRAFDYIFKGNEIELHASIVELSDELKNNILAFYEVVKAVRENSN
jgi:hypothetical protein